MKLLVMQTTPATVSERSKLEETTKERHLKYLSWSFFLNLVVPTFSLIGVALVSSIFGFIAYLWRSAF